MTKRKAESGKRLTTIGIDATQDNWLRKHREFNLSRFVRDKLNEIIEKEEVIRNE